MTTADTEILAVAEAVALLPAGFPQVRALNPARAPQDTTGRWIDDATAGAGVVLVRLLGGRSAFPELFDRLRERCADRRIPLLAFGGEDAPDAELTAASTAPSSVVADAFEYLRLGGVDNTANLLRFVADMILVEGFGFDPPRPVPPFGLYHPHAPDDAAAARRLNPDRPTVVVVFYRSHLTSGNVAFVDALLAAIEDRGANAVGLYCYSLRPELDRRVAALDHLRDVGVVPDALVVTVLAMGGSTGADDSGGWEVPALRDLGVPVVQGLVATVDRQRWSDSDSGLSPLDTAMQIALPEFDGRVIGVPFSFKEEVPAGRDTVGGPVVAYVPDRERAVRVAGLAVNHARLRRVPNADKRVAVVLSNYPTRHSRVGNGVGLDTPASTVRILSALRDAGYDLGDVDERLVPRRSSSASGSDQISDGDALIHTLIDAGGFDEEFLTEAQLSRLGARLDVDRYTRWFRDLPADLQSAVQQAWGPPPGELFVTPDGRHLAVAALRLGNVVVAIQPPRGFGANPVAIYHDPALAPTHHYLAVYWWLTREFAADAVVHVGKHGTLEWLPGKGVGLSATCGPDAALGDTPLFYPFVVNDPGEGTQAKRRAHATIVDHLVPPQMRAEAYDDLRRLEQLLDEYAEIELLDPAKLPALRAQVWELLQATEIARDLGADSPPDADRFGELITHVDGYLCEIKDLQVRGGLHVLGAPPRGEQLRGLVRAILRLPHGDVPGLRAAVAAVFHLDERALLDAPGEPVAAGAGRDALVAASPGPGRTGSDLLDRIEALVDALLERLHAKDWETAAVDAVVADVLGRPDASLADVLRFTCTQVVPRVVACRRELDRLVAGLDGHYLEAGPSGSPTRGRLDVLPTGKNFYSVDPKSIPTRLSWQVGQRLASDLLARAVADDGTVPETVGIVVWGTANMRTHGDDIAEILSLLGVRPVWDDETRRVVDLAVIELDELARPRIDVTVRVSGFFRDAFPNLVSLLDRAVQLVASLDEADEDNFVAKHARADRARLAAAGEGDDRAWRRATTRVFGAKPGAYGAGLLPLIDARNWRDVSDLAEVYAVWGGYAYGEGLDGAPARDDLETNLSRVAVAVKNIDTREHDILDSDDYFQEHGGMVATIRALTGVAPRAYIGDDTDPARPATRSLQEETNRIFRARVANPRWIAAMMGHGYKGAFELTATVDYMFGYDATAGVVHDWMYETVAARYVFDADTRAFLERSNPWALRAMTERLLEAADRRLWAQPRDDTLAQLRAAYLACEAALEDRTEDAP
ncbi:MAG: cobaltochelatase subunit CobN [Actinobacteria bacterium]|nr:cobaltochelatase subunit CobN [Actinomycetota bacterium]